MRGHSIECERFAERIYLNSMELGLSSSLQHLDSRGRRRIVARSDDFESVDRVPQRAEGRDGVDPYRGGRRRLADGSSGEGSWCDSDRDDLYA